MLAEMLQFESMMVKTLSALSTIIDDTLGAIFQELLPLILFVISFMVWRSMRKLASPRGKPSCSSKSKKHVCEPVKDMNLPSKAAKQDNIPDPKDIILNKAISNQQQEASAPHATTMLHVKAAEAQMHKLLQGREFTRAINMYRSFEKNGRDKYFQDEELFAAFIQASIRMGKIDVVERMMCTMRRNGVEPTKDFWQATMKLLSSRKHFSTCLTIFGIYGNDLPTDKIVYSCLINAALEVQQPDKAVSMLRGFEQTGLETNDYIVFFRTYVATDDLESAEAIYEQLGVNMSSIMLNLLLLICVNRGKPDLAWKHLCKAHELEKGLATPLVDRISYNTVLKGFALAGNPGQSFACLYEMRDHGLEPDDITLGTILDTCIVDNDFGAALKVADLLSNSDRPESGSDTVMCTLFIKGLVRLNCLPKALELYETMKRRENSHPDLVAYSVLIKACVDQHDLETALKIVEDMKAVGQSRDDIILTHLLEGCRHNSDANLGKKLFHDMIAQGVTPSEFTLITMLKLFGRCGAYDDAYKLVASWEKTYGSKPSIIHYTCLMSGCLRTKNYDQAWAAYKLMCEHRVSLDLTAVSTLLPGMVAAQQWDHVLTLVKHALQGPDPISIPIEILNNAYSQMLAAADRPDYVMHFRILMRSANIPITARRDTRR